MAKCSSEGGSPPRRRPARIASAIAACSSTPQGDSRAGSKADTISEERSSNSRRKRDSSGLPSASASIVWNSPESLTEAADPRFPRPRAPRRDAPQGQGRGLRRARQMKQHARLEHAMGEVDGSDSSGVGFGTNTPRCGVASRRRSATSRCSTFRTRSRETPNVLASRCSGSLAPGVSRPSISAA